MKKILSLGGIFSVMILVTTPAFAMTKDEFVARIAKATKIPKTQVSTPKEPDVTAVEQVFKSDEDDGTIREKLLEAIAAKQGKRAVLEIIESETTSKGGGLDGKETRISAKKAVRFKAGSDLHRGVR